MLFHLDKLTAVSASGWIYSELTSDPVVELEVWGSGGLLGRTRIDLLRLDVLTVHLDAPERCGFHVKYQLRDERALIEFRAKLESGNVLPITTKEVSSPNFDVIGQSLDLPFEFKTPFPLPVAKILRGVSGAKFNKELSDAEQLEAVDAIISLLQPEYAFQIPDLLSYVRFLRDSICHMESVAKYFPEVNPYSSPGANDYFCKTNSPAEMIAVAHHLFVLKSHGLTGSFAEFGCFKGYSSSMLTVPCNRLGIEMLIFDSFEGLPDSADPTYSAGEFRGSYSEVKRNIETFGTVEGVTLYRGFFADTLMHMKLPKLIEIWMDVDLYTSARDLAPSIDQLDKRGAIFSHECESRMFEDGRIVGLPRGPGNVVPAITDQLRKQGAKAVGRFIGGNTGAFYRQDVGIPVLTNDALLKLCSL